MAERPKLKGLESQTSLAATPLAGEFEPSSTFDLCAVSLNALRPQLTRSEPDKIWRYANEPSAQGLSAIALPLSVQPHSQFFEHMWPRVRTLEMANLLLAHTAVPFMEQKQAQQEFESAFQAARYVDFEDGIENEFSRRLNDLIRLHGPYSKDAVSRLLEDRTVLPETMSEALRWIGQIEDVASLSARRWVLEKALTASAPSIRNAAAIGLSSMNDSHAIPYLVEAIRVEKIDVIRRSMSRVIEQLKNPHF